MANNTQRYLDLISQHLQDHHAALFVGAGFSRNAEKINQDTPNSPLWDDLATIFIKKLSPANETDPELKKADPLSLAEHVEIAYGRPELDCLLLNSIRDSEYQPSSVHRKLLQLPWSDIFTTNYDTLLERAANDLTEQRFSVISCKDDLIGSSGATRIIKLHGSFPSQRPFIITSEDYRTYPRKFAPFVNTVQQSLLENTLCMLGFSGDDPNFNNWIGWIRDNLGVENAPYMYLLLHSPLSDIRKEWLRRKKIIPVDLSEIFKEQSPSAIYEKALDYLLDKHRQCNDKRQNWMPMDLFSKHSSQSLSVNEALPILIKNHDTCPGGLALSESQRDYLRNAVLTPASQILSTHCNQENPDVSDEIKYLYHYDWLRTKAFLPLFSSDMKNYQQVLSRHTDNHTPHKLSIQLSVLRTLRECAAWDEWEKLHCELLEASSYLTQEQLHHLRWEECLYSLHQYQFCELKKQLDNWAVPSDMPIWALRKAGLWAEYGDCERAHIILQEAILDIRKRLSYQFKPDSSLLSLESAMMHLQGFVSQASKDSPTTTTDEDGDQKANMFIDEQHRALHAQRNVSWDERNDYFVSNLNATWVPFRSHQVKATFDFGQSSLSAHFQEDKDRILAFSFLRFREETGIPFRIRNVYSNKTAACGAAERLALYTPYWSILTLVRADEPKEVENIITRGVLSSWTQEEADLRCQFYLDALLRTESELAPEDWFYRNSFARLTADVLPVVLSVLCTKCSNSMLEQLLVLLEKLYASSQKLCYQQIKFLVKRLLAVYPVSAYQELLPRLARFPLGSQDQDHMSRYFPDPLGFVSISFDNRKKDAQDLIPEIQSLLSNPFDERNRRNILNRLLHCFYCGLLTAPQKIMLRDCIWRNDELQIPSDWTRTVCLDLPAPPNIDVQKYLCTHITENIVACSGDKGVHYPNNETLIFELANFATTDARTFSPEQISAILVSLLKKIDSLSGSLSKSDDFMGVKSRAVSQVYNIMRSLWILTAYKEDWRPTAQDRQTMTRIITICEQGNIFHHGLRSLWSNLLGLSFSAENEFSRCLRSVNEKCSFHAYDVLSCAICHSAIPLLSTSEVKTGITVMAQQIAWCIPKQLVAALQTAVTVVEHQPDLLSSDLLELLLTGLSQLLPQTVITIDDTVESASEKGSIRKAAAILARKMHRANLCGERPEILEGWLKIFQNNNEFAEIRNA